MANGTGAGMGLGSSTSTAGKYSKGTSSGKSTKGTAAKRGGRPAAIGADRPAATRAGRPGLTSVSQLLAGTGAPGGVPEAGEISGAGVPTGMPGMFGAGIPSGGRPVSIGGLPTMPGDPSQYDFGMQDMGDAASLDFGSEARTPTSYIGGRGGSQVGSVSEQSVADFMNNLTMSKLENLSPEQKTAFDERMIEATKRKESGVWPEGIDPELMEKRITAAESEKWPNSSKFYKELRSLQAEPTTLQNVGSMLKTGARGAGKFLRNLGPVRRAFPPPLWPATGPAQREGRVRQHIIRGEGTPVDWRKTSEFIANKRAENYAAGITVPPRKEYIGSYERGSEGRINQIPYGINLVNAPDLSLPPKPSTYEARKRTVATQPQQPQSTGYNRYGDGGRVNLLSRIRKHRKEDEEIEKNRLLMAMGRFNPEATHELPVT